MCKTEKRAMLRPESNNFATTEWDKKDLFHFCTGHHLETMKYKVRNEILPIKRLNYGNAMNCISVFRATGRLNAIPNGSKI